MLDLGLQTVRSYRKTMMKKLGVNNVAGLTQVALAAGITRFPVRSRTNKLNRWKRPGALCLSPTRTSISFRIDSSQTLAEQKEGAAGVA